MNRKQTDRQTDRQADIQRHWLMATYRGNAERNVVFTARTDKFGFSQNNTAIWTWRGWLVQLRLIRLPVYTKISCNSSSNSSI